MTAETQDILHPYDRAERLMETGELDQLNAELRAVRIEAAPTDVLVAWLTATLPVRSKLPSRPAFYREAKREIKRRRHWEPGLFDGLG